MKATEPLDLETFVPCPGITLIEASAGTGKTHSISNLVARWICEGRFNLSSLLILTFTEAATTELKERIRAELLARKKRFSKEARAEAGLRHVKAALA
ncbi:MAG: UvrD-helicase domain-containing protein, partial [Opitutales bacterium]|nr:UvrD-helicase domain-containing protein [Opitutales bacterium]